MLIVTLDILLIQQVLNLFPTNFNHVFYIKSKIIDRSTNVKISYNFLCKYLIIFEEKNK